LFVNQLIDHDEKLEKMCPSCREEVTSKCKCTRCGKDMPHDDEDSFVNPNFNEEEYMSKSIM
jgi:tRNA(Ile2) C34 agmatinyltransferase TiaS